MYPRRRSSGMSDGYREGSYKRQRVQPEYPPYSSTYDGYHGAGGGYPQGPRFGSSGVGPGNAFPAVRLRGLPFNCTERDVYEFFNIGLDIVNIVFVKKQGRFSGDAFVVFATALHADFALRKDRQNMGHRYVEVYRSKKQEYYQAIVKEMTCEHKPTRRRDQSNASNSAKDNNGNNDKDDVEHTGVLKLRGLPFSVTKNDIIEFFSDYEVSEENVQIVYRSNGKATGDAFVEFESARGFQGRHE